MSYKLIIRAAAERDIAEAAGWYDGERPGLGGEFVTAIRRVTDRIARLPESFPIVEGNVRRALTRPFPYGVFFTIHNRRVVVMAVAHCSRDPGFWRGRR